MKPRVSVSAVVLSLALFALSATHVSAWGAVGHRVVARIAWVLMTPAAQERATALLGGGMETFVAAATWADEVRNDRPGTYNWHFVDIPVGQPRYMAARDCPATEQGDCVIAAIARLRAQLVDASDTPERRAEALKFLIHFVGDLHQPLHTIDNHDRGGNDVKVLALRGEDGRNTNLHAVWDTGLINLSTETELARAERLLIDLASRPPTVDLDVVQWVEENHDVGEKVTYKYPGFSAAGPPPDPVALDAAYRAAALKTIDRQLELGGARLAALLNALLGSK